MGRRPRSGDIPWLSAHSILNWIGGDVSMLVLFGTKSSVMCRNLQGVGLEKDKELTPWFSIALRRPATSLTVEAVAKNVLLSRKSSMGMESHRNAKAWRRSSRRSSKSDISTEGLTQYPRAQTFPGQHPRIRTSCRFLDHAFRNLRAQPWNDVGSGSLAHPIVLSS